MPYPESGYQCPASNAQEVLPAFLVSWQFDQLFRPMGKVNFEVSTVAYRDIGFSEHRFQFIIFATIPLGKHTGCENTRPNCAVRCSDQTERPIILFGKKNLARAGLQLSAINLTCQRRGETGPLAGKSSQRAGPKIHSDFSGKK